MCACFVPMIGMLPLVAFNRRKTDDPRWRFWGKADMTRTYPNVRF